MLIFVLYKPECRRLFIEKEHYPVTLFYLPLEWCGEASSFCMDLFGGPGIVNASNCLFGVLFSRQAKEVKEVICGELKKKESRIRLVFCSSVIGMGFDAPSITRVIHGRPPRNLNTYFQEIGRAGRKGQAAEAILYFNNNDIARNLPGIQDDIIRYCRSVQCLRKEILVTYGFESPVSDVSGCSCCDFCKERCSCGRCNTVN